MLWFAYKLLKDKNLAIQFTSERRCKMATPLGNAEWWHQNAEQCRARADKFEDPIIRERMLMIADGYDRIAHDAEKIEAGKAVPT